MRARVLLLVALTSALATAGCFGGEAVTPASIRDRASLVDELLANPPGSEVRPTGDRVEFDLYLHRMENHEVFPGAFMTMWGFSLDPDPTTAQIPGPTLRVTAGDTVVVNFRSTVAGFNHTLHWHGQHVPYEQDGVPYLTQNPVEAEEVFTYEFVAKPAGTYWYHCHVDAQHHVDMGMYGVLIVDPQDPADDPRHDKEFVMVMDDMDRFHLETGQPVMGNLPQNGDPWTYEEWAKRQSGDTVNRNPAVSDKVTGTPLRPTRDPAKYGGMPTYPPYTADYNTFLINGFSFPYTEPLVVSEGDVVRIRMVNAGNVVFAMHLHGHHMLVTHKDGVAVLAPWWADTVMLAPGERYDVFVKMDNPGLWDFHDHVGGHTQNDDIFPGGAMTMLVYDQFASGMGGGGHDHGGGGRVRTSGDVIGWSRQMLP